MEIDLVDSYKTFLAIDKSVLEDLRSKQHAKYEHLVDKNKSSLSKVFYN